MSGEPHPCPATLTRNIWTCYCKRAKDHTGNHQCRCGVTWSDA